jgi:formate-nitrite transporter family protein
MRWRWLSRGSPKALWLRVTSGSKLVKVGVGHESGSDLTASWILGFKMAERREVGPLPLLLPIRPDDHVRGPADAAYTLVEYGDYECPDCGRLFKVIRDLQGDMLRIAFRHYPLSGIHPHAQLAAEAAEAAGAQNRFWEMHDLLFENQKALEPNHLYGYAEQLGLNTKRFRDELKGRRYENLVREHFRRGVQNGVYGTPGLYVNGIRYAGPLDVEALRGQITNSGHDSKSPVD